jgi:hypothetical protein
MPNTTTQKLNAIALSQAVQDSKENFLLRQELFLVVASDLKAKYDALITAGFNTEQALDLLIGKAI